LSKIERGQLIPTLPTLLRIALVFGVGLEHFFAESDEGPHYAMTRKAERLQLPNLPGTDPVAYRLESLDFPLTERKMEAFYGEFPTAGAASRPHRHEGTELVYVIKGELTIILEEEEIALSEADAITFESGTPMPTAARSALSVPPLSSFGPRESVQGKAIHRNRDTRQFTAITGPGHGKISRMLCRSHTRFRESCAIADKAPRDMPRQTPRENSFLPSLPECEVRAG
jgi:hypothetical protein